MAAQSSPSVRDNNQGDCPSWIAPTTKSVLTVALIVIASLGIASILPGSTIGWLIVGTVGAGLTILHFTKGRERTFCSISTTFLAVTLIILGTLTGVGYLTVLTISGIVLGAFALIALYGLYKAGMWCKERLGC